MFDELFITLKEIISEKYSASDSSGSVITLQETGKPEKIKLQNKGKILVYRFDKPRGKGVNTFLDLFHCNRDLICKMCDYVLVSHSKNKIFVFLVELKSNATNNPMQQILAGFLLSQFIFLTCKRIFNGSFPEIEYRGLIVSKMAPVKGNTKSTNLNYLKEKIFHLPWQHIRYPEILDLERYKQD